MMDHLESDENRVLRMGGENSKISTEIQKSIETITADLFSHDGKREIGLIAITAWYHVIAKILIQQKIAVPPVLPSTLGALLALFVVKGVKGKEFADNVVEYFDPSVDFLGTWMPLWLVPNLVLLPYAVGKIENTTKSMWVKLFITTFVLWCGSAVGTAKLYELIESNLVTSKIDTTVNDLKAIIDKDTTEITKELISKHGEINNEIGDKNNEDNELSRHSSESLICNDGQMSDNKDDIDRINSNVTSNYSPLVFDSDPIDKSTNIPDDTSEEELKKKNLENKLRLLKFWGGVTVFFYAAPMSGFLKSKTPALASTTVTALIAGNMMSDKVKKIVHPLLFASIISAIAAVISDKYLNINKDNLQEIFLLKSKPWEESLFTFTSPPHISQDIKAGDYFGLVIGPACVALAFRIFSQTEKLEAKLPSILIATAVSAATSLVVSPALGAYVGIPAEINASLAHRSVASSLAIPSSKLAGASTELTMAAVLLTGLYGASGQWLLDKFSVVDPVTTGVSVGTSSHSMGTASLLPHNPESAAVASVALVSTGIFHAALCSIPGVPAALKRLAGGK